MRAKLLSLGLVAAIGSNGGLGCGDDARGRTSQSSSSTDGPSRPITGTDNKKAVKPGAKLKAKLDGAEADLTIREAREQGAKTVFRLANGPTSPGQAVEALPLCKDFFVEVIFEEAPTDGGPKTIRIGTKGRERGIQVTRDPTNKKLFRSKVVGFEFYWSLFPAIPDVADPPARADDHDYAKTRGWALDGGSLQTIVTNLEKQLMEEIRTRDTTSGLNKRFELSAQIALRVRWGIELANDDAVLKTLYYHGIVRDPTATSQSRSAMATEVAASLKTLDRFRAMLAEEQGSWARDAWAHYFKPEEFQKVINAGHWTALKLFKWHFEVLLFFTSPRVFRIIPPPPPKFDTGPGLRQYPTFKGDFGRYRCVPDLTTDVIHPDDPLITVPMAPTPVPPAATPASIPPVPPDFQPLAELLKRLYNSPEYQRRLKEAGYQNWRAIWKMLFEKQEELNKLADMLGLKREHLFPDRKSFTYEDTKKAGFKPGLPEDRSKTTAAYRDKHGIGRRRLSNADIDHIVSHAVGKDLYGEDWNPNYEENLMPLSSPVNQGDKQQWEKTTRELIKQVKDDGSLSPTEKQEKLKKIFDGYMDHVYDNYLNRGGGRDLPRVVPESKLTPALRKRLEDVIKRRGTDD